MSELAAGQRFSNYDLEELIGETTKSLVFRAKHSSLGREDIVKILRPNQPEERQVQFLEEGTRLVNLCVDEKGTRRPKNLPIVYDAGVYENMKYIAMELIDSEEGDLEKVATCGRKIPLEDLIQIGIDATNGLATLNDLNIVHGDVKLKNLVRDRNKVTYVIDLGGRLSQTGEYQNDIVAMGQVLEEVLKKTEGKIPSRLREIIESGKKSGYKSMREFNESLVKYNRNRVTRRRFLFAGGIATGLVAVGIPTFLVHKHLAYEDSAQKIIDEMKSAEGPKIDELDAELKRRLFYQKVLEWDKLIPPGEFPFGTDGKEWFSTKSQKTDAGFLTGIFAQAYKRTNDAKFLEIAKRRGADITTDHSQDEAFPVYLLRFYHSHAQLGEIATQDSEKLAHRKKAIDALDRFTRNYDPDQKIISMTSKRFDFSEAGLVYSAVPFLWWAYSVTSDEKYASIARNHVLTAIDANIREDGSVRKTAIFKRNGDKVKVLSEENSKGYKPSSTHSRSQAQMLFGLAFSLRYMKEDRLFRATKSVADYFIRRIGEFEDLAPAYDFDAPRNSPKDSGALCFGESGLRLFSKIDDRALDIARRIRKSLTVNFLVPDNKASQGLIIHSCHDFPRSEYTDCAQIGSDHFYLTNF